MYKVVLTFASVDEVMNGNNSNVLNRATDQAGSNFKSVNESMKCVTEQHFPVVLLKVCCIYGREKNSIE